MRVVLDSQLQQVCFLQEVRAIKPFFFFFISLLAVVAINCPSDTFTQHLCFLGTLYYWLKISQNW